MVASTVQRTGEAARAVDDLEETLAIFDLKLRHMREAWPCLPLAIAHLSRCAMQDLREQCMSEPFTKVAMGRWMSELLSNDRIMNELSLSGSTQTCRSPNPSHKRSNPSTHFCDEATYSSPQLHVEFKQTLIAGLLRREKAGTSLAYE